MSSSSFEDNKHNGLNGLVFVDKRSSLDAKDNDFGSDNKGSANTITSPYTSNISCNGIFYETGDTCPVDSVDCKGHCEGFKAVDSGPSEDEMPNGLGPCPTDSSVSGYSNLFKLQSALLSQSNDGGLFVLCPFTKFIFLDEPILIARNGTKIQCGLEGSSADGCIFYGGQTHINIQDGTSDLVVSGVRMVGSSGISIKATGAAGSSVSFFDCHWLVSLDL